MGRRREQTFSKDIDDQQACENTLKLLIIFFFNQRNLNQNHNEILPGYHRKATNDTCW